MKKVTVHVTVLLMLLAVGGLVFAGGGKETPAASAAQPRVQISSDMAKEAPMLARQVEAGNLPALEERLPVASDVMVETMDSIGAYGDHITMSFRGKDDQWFYGKITEEPLFRFKTDGTIEPNVAKGYSVNEDATEFRIYLREGMKWSDGVPFTAEDVIFFFEHMCKPKTFGKSLWDCFYSTDPVTKERTVCTMEKVNDYEVKVTFANPSPNFLENLAINGKWCFAPAHYHKQILAEFIGDSAAVAKAKELGYSDVKAMGKETGYYYWNVVGLPTLRPWVSTNSPDSDLFIMERNPYFWKTDAEGRQLPYVDELQFVRRTDENQKVLKAMAGETDIAVELSYSNIVPLKENEKKGDYTLTTWAGTSWSAPSAALQLNQTVEDPKLRSLFQNKDFRKALSIAADREEICSLVFDGFSEPTQASPASGAQGYSQAWTKKWTEYDPAQARKILESIGLKMGSDGYFDYADGSDLLIEILSYDETSETSKVAELLTEKYFKNVGIKATFSVRDRSLIDDLSRANKLVAVLSPVAPMETISISLRPDTLVPVRNYAVWYGTYGDWYSTDGKTGMEPTGDMKKLIDLYRDMLSATDKASINKIAAEMLKLHEENIWQIGYASDSPTLFAVNNDLKNFPMSSIYCDEFRGLGIAHMHTAYFASDKQ